MKIVSLMQMRHYKQFIDFGWSCFNQVMLFADLIRLFFLKRTMKIELFKWCYIKTSYRLFISYLVSSVVYLLIALTFPDILLIFGPLIYGYFHLVASYKFMQPKFSLSPFNLFKYLWSMTFFVVLIRAFFPEIEASLELARGGWAMIWSFAIFSFFILLSRAVNKRSLVLVGILNIMILRLAWIWPLSFVSATLFIHNWIAFIYWIITAKDKDNRLLALFALVFFGVIHGVVAFGLLDSFLFFTHSNTLTSANVGAISWILTPWSDDVLVGKRALVLYTFGLSVHYFIWLKAIPENKQTIEVPNSFRLGFKKFSEETGKSIVVMLLLASFIGILIWLFSFKLGALIYFTIASLHIWLELNFLVLWPFFKRKSFRNGSEV